MKRSKGGRNRLNWAHSLGSTLHSTNMKQKISFYQWEHGRDVLNSVPWPLAAPSFHSEDRQQRIDAKRSHARFPQKVQWQMCSTILNPPTMFLSSKICGHMWLILHKTQMLLPWRKWVRQRAKYYFWRFWARTEHPKGRVCDKKVDKGPWLWVIMDRWAIGR